MKIHVDGTFIDGVDIYTIDPENEIKVPKEELRSLITRLENAAKNLGV